MNTRIFFALAAAISLMSCAGSKQQSAEVSANPVVSGTVTYRQRIALSPEAMVSVKLLDISLADVAATEIATLAIDNPGQVPIPFELRYNPELIRENMVYSVRAEIRENGRLLFTTDTVHPVLTRGNGNRVELVLIPVGAAAPSKPLLGTRWVLSRVNGEAVTFTDTQPTAYLRLVTENNAVEGSSGCNRMAGTFSLEGDKLNLGALAMTMMACVDGMETERAFTQALDRMNRYEIDGDTLYGFADDELLLEFTADEESSDQL